MSGGQSGVDRAALDAALEAGLPCGGWCPAGRWAEDGPIPPRYPLRETSSTDPAERTRWNVRDSDATLILVRGDPAGGTLLTVRAARLQGRPALLLDPSSSGAEERVLEWLAGQRVRVLNVAGPRESEDPGIHAVALALLGRILQSIQRSRECAS